MSELYGDPPYPPGRPRYHPDFDPLTEAVMRNDALSDSGVSNISDLVGEVADSPTATWFALQRAMMFGQLLGLPITQAPLLSGLWLDGMIAGHRLAQAQREREQET